MGVSCGRRAKGRALAKDCPPVTLSTLGTHGCRPRHSLWTNPDRARSHQHNSIACATPLAYIYTPLAVLLPFAVSNASQAISRTSPHMHPLRPQTLACTR